ncbi:MAG: ArnT family glycosyltransferase [Daejeonella sp.]
MPRPLLWLIVISTTARMSLAWILELGNDEVYYTTYAFHLQENYFDHPPGVALLIRLFSANLQFQNELFVRLGSIVCAAIGTILSYKIGTLIRNQRTGLYAAILYNTSIYTSIISGTFILPDSPQVIFWLGALLFMFRIIISSERNEKVPFSNWLYFGILSGCCVMCKVHGIFLWGGIGLYILFLKRNMLLDRGLYFSLIATILIISPIAYWNLENNFVTWNYHSNRVTVHQQLIDTSGFLKTFFGQLLYNNPVNVFIIAAALYNFRKKQFLDTCISRVILFTGLPIIVITTLMSLFNPVLPHWSGPGFMTLTFFAAAYLDRITEVYNKAVIPVLKASIALITTIALLGVTVIKFYPGTIGSNKISDYGKGDFTLDMWGWKDFGKQFSSFIRQQKGTGLDTLKIVSNKWFPAAHIEFYIAKPLHKDVIGVGDLVDLHHYVWLNQYRSDLQTGSNALCIVPSNYSLDAGDVYKNYFSSVHFIRRFCTTRNGKPARYFSVYLLKDFHSTDEAHRMAVSLK